MSNALNLSDNLETGEPRCKNLEKQQQLKIQIQEILQIHSLKISNRLFQGFSKNRLKYFIEFRIQVNDYIYIFNHIDKI